MCTMKYKVINTGTIAESVQIVHADGRKDYVHIQAKSKATLPSGCFVPANYKATHKHIIVKEVE